MSFNAEYENVSSDSSCSDCYPCNPCTPDEVKEDGSQCYPCNPCSPDQLRENGSQCYPCNPCSPDQRSNDGSQCYPCNPCSPDQRSSGGDQCYPCNPCTPDQGESYSSYSGSSGDSGCFITSACVEAMDLPDDCVQLQTLRVLRDKRKLYDSEFSAMVEEYYRIAPAIVSAIDRASDRKARYTEIYEQMVMPCVNMVRQNRENDAVRLYTDTVLKLKACYLGAV